MHHKIGQAVRAAVAKRSSLRPVCLIVFGLLLSLAALPAPVVAQAREVVVARRDGAISVQPNGDLRVVETWEVRFIGGPFQFAFRSIPLNRLDDIQDWQVAENGRPFRESAGEEPGTFKVEDDGGERKITWHFEPTTDRTRTFLVEYTVIGALRMYPDGDQLFWKFVESGRAYPIEASRVVVSLPGVFDPDQLKLQTYLDGAETGAGRVVDGRTLEFTGGPFPANAEWEIRAQFPHGVVTAPVAAWQAREQRVAAWRPVGNLASLALALLILVGGLLAMYLRWYLRGRDRGGLLAEFFPEPPEAIPPGMAGTVLDERADMQDILATLVDLARRGYLRIVEDRKKGFRFIRLRDADDALRPYERLLFEKIFGRRDERLLEDLNNKFSQSMRELESCLYDETVKAGYFAGNPEGVRTRFMLAGLALAIVGSVAGFITYIILFDYAPLGILVVLALVALGIALAIFGQYMPAKTRQGAAAAAKWRAFKRYLQHIDRYTEVAQARDQFERYLPYAIAFGLEKEWIRTFEKARTAAPEWYRPASAQRDSTTLDHHHSHSRNASDRSSGERPAPGSRQVASGGSGAHTLDKVANRGFTGLNSMSAGFFSMLNSAASAFTSAPASSSDSGGSGGFSGGGGGGGGSGGGSSGFG